MRRSRRLVVSSISTVGNYEYGFYWYFYQDGAIQLEVKMTGVISNGAEPPGSKPIWGELVAPQVYGPIHQHFFNVRLDMMVDGPDNSVYEVNTVADPPGPGEPAPQRVSHRGDAARHPEAQAQRIIDPLAGRFWKIVNPSVRNRLGEPVAYKLMPGENVLPFAAPEASVTQARGLHDQAPVGDAPRPARALCRGRIPEPAPGRRGPARYVADDAPLENTDVVVWYTFGAHHVVRPEDWPVMPVTPIGFMLKPVASSTATPRSTCPGRCPMGPAPTAARHATPRDGASPPHHHERGTARGRARRAREAARVGCTATSRPAG